MLELCFAVALPAIGSAIVFNVGASTGGTDIVAMILSKYTGLEVGRALLVSDLAIAVWAGGLYGIATGLYCICLLYTSPSWPAPPSWTCPTICLRSAPSAPRASCPWCIWAAAR